VVSASAIFDIQSNYDPLTYTKVWLWNSNIFLTVWLNWQSKAYRNS
jgi:hypothetical protein